MKTQWHGRFEDLAMNLLRETNLYPLMPEILRPSSMEIDVKSVAIKKGIKLVEYDFGDDISGVLLYDGKEATIGYSRNNGSNRQRFTIAHELGHYTLGHQRKGVFVDTADKYFPPKFRNKDSSTGDNLQEVEANAFAAALLMPEKLVMEVIDKIKLQHLHLEEDYNLTDQLAGFFSVSPQAMLFRLNRLDIFEDYGLNSIG